MGSRKTHTRPSRWARSKQVRSSPGASAGWLGTASTSPGMSRRTATRVVVVEVTAEPALVGEAGDPDHHAVLVLPVGEEPQGRGLAAQLVLGVVQVGQVLDLGDGHEAGERRPERHTQDGLLVEQGVEHPATAEPLPQTAGDAVDPALDRDVLAEDQRLGMGGHQVRESGVDRLRQRHRGPVLGAGQPGGRRGPGRAGGRGGQGERSHHRLPGGQPVLVERSLGLVHHLGRTPRRRPAPPRRT